MDTPTRKRILLADDDPQLRRLLRRALERAGYSVTVVANGLEAALRYAEEAGAFDLAIMDIRMPELQGDQTYDLLRREYPEARFLFVSGVADQCTWDRLRADPNVRCLRKPFRAVDLLTMVEALLGHHDDTHKRAAG